MNLSRIVERHAQFSPDQVALHVDGKDIAYLDLWRAVERGTAAVLAAGVQPGDRVAWLGLNDPSMLVLLMALARIGAILLPLNYRLAPAEHQAILAHAGASLLVSDAVYRAAAQQLAQGGGISTLDAEALEEAQVVEEGALQGADASPVLLVYTSGTTGQPKGALHTQAGLLWNCANAVHANGLQAGDHVLTVLPLFHVGGLCIQTLPALVAGARVTLQPRFDAAAWLDAVQQQRPTLTVMVPATMRAVREHARWDTTDLSSLRLLVAGSSVVPPDLIAAFHARGVAVGQVYGATETGPVSIYLRREDAFAHPGSAGKPGMHVEVRVVDSAGRDVAQGAVGEIRIRGANVMARYWSDPDNPAFQDGWFHSGDLARVDAEGFFRVMGRSREMVISGGENIYPAEIENILDGCAEIAESAVLGQPDPQWGEVVVAVVAVRPGAALDEAGVRALFEGRLARYKMPRRIVFRATLPRTALGKVQKGVLADWLQQQIP